MSLDCDGIGKIKKEIESNRILMSSLIFKRTNRILEHSLVKDLKFMLNNSPMIEISRMKITKKFREGIMQSFIE